MQQSKETSKSSIDHTNSQKDHKDYKSSSRLKEIIPKNKREKHRKDKSRSRSRSNSNHRRDKKQHKHGSNSSPYSDRSSNSKSKSRSRSKQKHVGKRFKDIPNNVKNPSSRFKEDGTRRVTVNNIALAGLLLESRKTNERLDKEETAKANVHFKKLDHSERQATLLSGYLNSEEVNKNRDEYMLEYRDGEYVKVAKPFICQYNNCGMRFSLSIELVDHMENHKKNEIEINRKKADQFAQKLGIN